MCTAVSETVGDALKSAAKAFSAGDATGDKAGSVGGKFRSDGEIGKEGEKGEFAFLLELPGARIRVNLVANLGRLCFMMMCL